MNGDETLALNKGEKKMRWGKYLHYKEQEAMSMGCRR